MKNVLRVLWKGIFLVILFFATCRLSMHILSTINARSVENGDTLHSYFIPSDSIPIRSWLLFRAEGITAVSD
jgi:hypothetical protein